MSVNLSVCVNECLHPESFHVTLHYFVEGPFNKMVSMIIFILSQLLVLAVSDPRPHTQIILPKGHSHPNQTKTIHPGTHGQDKNDQLTLERRFNLGNMCHQTMKAVDVEQSYIGKPASELNRQKNHFWSSLEK